MAKRIVVCLDGTWNRPADNIRSTNVVKIMRAVRHTAADGTEQISFYDKGVGTGGPLDRLNGGAFGRGLDDNVQDGYRFLANNYEPGDEIYIFGFSRGAFTARSLAGFIGATGLLDRKTMGSMDEAWEMYRTPPALRDMANLAGMRALARHPVAIRCIGVWDTVGALGVPIEQLKWMSAKRYQFHDTTLGKDVACGLHALAIDEKRGPFAPTLWEAEEEVPGQVVEQVWFPGVHSNVGGGYPDRGLSDVALDWMIKRVRAHTPLEFDAGFIKAWIKPHAMGTIYESRSKIYAFSRVAPYQRVLGGNADWVSRTLKRFNAPAPGHHYVNEMIHQSALDRFGQSAPLRENDKDTNEFYEPESVAAARGKMPVVGHDGKVV